MHHTDYVHLIKNKNFVTASKCQKKVLLKILERIAHSKIPHDLWREMDVVQNVGEKCICAPMHT